MAYRNVETHVYQEEIFQLIPIIYRNEKLFQLCTICYHTIINTGKQVKRLRLKEALLCRGVTGTGARQRSEPSKTPAEG